MDPRCRILIVMVSIWLKVIELAVHVPFMSIETRG